MPSLSRIEHLEEFSLPGTLLKLLRSAYLGQLEKESYLQFLLPRFVITYQNRLTWTLIY